MCCTGVRISSLVQRGEGAEGGGGGPRGKQETLDVFVHPLSTNTTRDDWPAEQVLMGIHCSIMSHYVLLRYVLTMRQNTQ